MTPTQYKKYKSFSQAKIESVIQHKWTTRRRKPKVTLIYANLYSIEESGFYTVVLKCDWDKMLK